MVITVQPDSHCIRHRRHLVYFQHHLRQYYDLFSISLNHKKMIHKKIPFLLLTSLVRLADKSFLTPNLRNSRVIVNSKTVGLRLFKYNHFTAFHIVNPGCAIPPQRVSEIKRTLDNQEHNPEPTEPTILSFSRLDLIQKGLNLILKVAPLTPNYKFIIAGPCHDSISKINNHNLPNVMFIFKNFSDEEKDCLYRKCDVFLAPYIGEDFGITPLEANLYGKPVVYCNDSGEIVNTQTNKVTGYMCNRNPQSLVKGIDFCISNKEKMKSNCILNGSKYTWQNFEESIRKHVELLATKG